MFPDTTATETIQIQTAEVDDDTQVVTTIERSTQGSLKGNPPKVFDGTRADSENFVQDFKIYWKINRRNAIMDEPYSRIVTALSYIKGEKVKDWVTTQLDLLDKKIQDGVLYSDERLWAAFDKAFADAFTNITKEQDAYSALKDLKMVGEDLDTFIATHGNLVHRAGWKPDGDAAIETFRNGLKRGLHYTILRRDDVPKTLQAWKDAARKEQAKFALMKASGFHGGQGKKGQRQNQWKQALGRQSKPARDPDAMDVDNTRLAPLTEEEKKQMFREGRCLRCREKGHMARNCPRKWNNNQTQWTPPKTDTRLNEIVDDRSEAGSETTVVSNRSSVDSAQIKPEMVIRVLEGYSKEQRDALLDQILQKGEDF